MTPTLKKLHTPPRKIRHCSGIHHPWNVYKIGKPHGFENIFKSKVLTPSLAIQSPSGQSLHGCKFVFSTAEDKFKGANYNIMAVNAALNSLLKRLEFQEGVFGKNERLSNYILKAFACFFFPVARYLTNKSRAAFYLSFLFLQHFWNRLNGC